MNTSYSKSSINVTIQPVLQDVFKDFRLWRRNDNQNGVWDVGGKAANINPPPDCRHFDFED